jgi:signal transduction histidine kinase
LRSADDFVSIRRQAAASPPAGLLKQIEAGGQIGASLRNIGNCSRRIAALVRSLKVYARADEEWADDTDVNATLEDVLAILTSKIKHLTLHKEYSPLPPIRSIPSQLQQVWTNLIHNAVQAMEGCGAITLRTSVPRPGLVRVEIEDDGPGIPPEVQQKIYQPRFTTKAGRVEFGLGLGLPICRSIIDRLGGTLSFDSRPGRTVFSVELPVQAPPSPTEPAVP